MHFSSCHTNGRHIDEDYAPQKSAQVAEQDRVGDYPAGHEEPRMIEVSGLQSLLLADDTDIDDQDATSPAYLIAQSHAAVTTRDVRADIATSNVGKSQPAQAIELSRGDFRRFSDRKRKQVGNAGLTAPFITSPIRKKPIRTGRDSKVQTRNEAASVSFRSPRHQETDHRNTWCSQPAMSAIQDVVRLEPPSMNGASLDSGTDEKVPRKDVSSPDLTQSQSRIFTGPPTMTSDKHELLLAASRSIMHKTRIEEKPAAHGRPEVWADSRQALCETVLYYQAWQGGSYISKGVLYSFMFDSNGDERDLIDGDVVIARAGGAMTRDKSTKELYQCKNQQESGQTQAIRNAIAQQAPIVIFCGGENSNVPTKMPHRYNSLGWFKVTHIWAEKKASKRGNVIIIKYRFEKLGDYESWWDNRPTRAFLGDFGPAVRFECSACRKTWDQILLVGWMCLCPDCSNFWSLANGKPPLSSQVDYDPRFLKQRTLWQVEEPPHPVRPPLPRPMSRPGDDKIYAMTRGLCCPLCGKCTSRYRWDMWLCSNCGFEHRPQQTVLPAEILMDPWHLVTASLPLSHDWAATNIVQINAGKQDQYKVTTYRFSGITGFISHLVPNKVILQGHRGCDEMFEAIQTLDCGLERRRFAAGREEYMNAFSNNRGMPYKFIGDISSTPFEDAPWPLQEGRSRLCWAANAIVGDEFVTSPGFNEMLTIGYFEKQVMRYHDDGERGLGPTVASLSLGFSADMSFRVKYSHWTGMSKSGLLTMSKPLPSTPFHEASKHSGQWPPVLDSNRPRAEELRRLAETLELRHDVKERRPWLRMRLGHGDIVIMHGREIQEYLEHQVESLGNLRFAMTCRTILPEHLTPSEMAKWQSDKASHEEADTT